MHSYKSYPVIPDRPTGAESAASDEALLFPTSVPAEAASTEHPWRGDPALPAQNDALAGADWIDAEPEQYREIMRRYGAHPDQAGGWAHNVALRALIDIGVTGDDLETQAQTFVSNNFTDIEPEEEDYPLEEIEWEAECSRET